VAMLKTRPMCHRCGRLVDSVEEVEIFDRVRFVIRCHGDSEQVELSAAEAQGLKSLQWGEAFTEPRLLESGK
jgi:hypothetical protein